MCRIPKVVIVAPADMHQDLRRKLGSLEYDIAATVASSDVVLEGAGINGDVVIVWEPDEEALLRLRAFGLKTVAVGGDAQSADMTLGPDDVASFKTRIWELFRPA